jgi:Fe-S cluster biosynthesis and repair protein YggX/rhodanese-related sulfurtransferase
MDLTRVSAEEAKRLIDVEGYVLLDVRSIAEFGDRHAAGAYNVPFLHKTAQGMIPNQDFAKVVQGLFPDPETRLVTSCQMGGRSVRAAAELKSLGYRNVVDLRGGFGSEKDDAGRVIHPGWLDSSLPVEEGGGGDRAYESLFARVFPKPEAPAAVAPHAAEHHAPSGEGMNRFASDKRTVACVKLHKTLPGLKRRPYPGPLGERIFQEISAEAWNQWVEHSKMIINEYRIQTSDPKAMQLLTEQCEAFLFGAGGVKRPEGYVPESGV